MHFMDGEQPTSVVERWLAAGDRGDVDAFDSLLHPNAVVHAPRGLSTTEREAEKKVWRDALAAMPDLRHEVQEVNPVYAARYRHLTNREKNKLKATQAQTVIAAAILRHLHAVITTGQRWDPLIATHGTRAVKHTMIAA
jgi:ketosteroid isomerase-like protein